MTRLIRLPEVLDRTALKRSTLYSLVAAGKFPRPLKAGTRTNAWAVSEIDAWIETRLTARD